VAGIEEAEKLSKALVRHGCVVVSGLAAGIDTAAHSAALAEGGRTIAVLGTPVDQVYPASNRSLQARLAVEQLVVSQFPSGQRTRPEHFVLRNRTMALFSHASIIVESGESSGTQHQGWEMLRLGRPVFLHPLLSDSPVLKWPREMMRHGARVLTTLDEVLDELPTVGSDSEAHAPF
jgi:DNA processing protein